MINLRSRKIVKTVRTLLYFLLITSFLLLVSCGGERPKEEVRRGPVSKVVHPDWSRNADIYEVNIRQFTPEGTFKAFEEHIPRLKKMGVDILWLMPIHPIGVKNRKGELGSYYSVKDYEAVNPEYGSMQDLVDLVKKAHKEKMYVILDWVANHTAWDNHWVKDHPDWYTRDSTGSMVSPFDWSDVADLNYDNKELRDTMVDCMKFWLKKADIDGFRCDVAAMVPTEFWDSARKVLEKVKPVFMLAEAEEPALLINAFDMDYSWDLYKLMHMIAIGEADADTLEAYYKGQDTLYPADAYRMLFTSNHDENSWNGTEYEQFGAGVLTFALLTATLPGMPLIYNGQESAFNHRLEFFKKDTIDWKDYSLVPFYRKLLALKHIYQPLWNGNWGGRLQRIHTTADTAAFIFMRDKEGDRILVMTNLTDKVINPELKGDNYAGKYKEWFSEKEEELKGDMTLRLKPWEYRVYVRTGK